MAGPFYKGCGVEIRQYMPGWKRNDYSDDIVRYHNLGEGGTGSSGDGNYKEIAGGSQRMYKKKALVTATNLGFFHFLKNDLKILAALGYEIHIAANTRLTDYKMTFAENVTIHHIPFSRRPVSIENVTAFCVLKSLLRQFRFDLIHCHTPVAGVVTRIAAAGIRKHGTVVMYTAHGFHFFRGAPWKNWMLYYPVEKSMSRITDVLITVNREDFGRAKHRFYACRIYYIPGVGIDTKKFSGTIPDRETKRRQLGIKSDQFVLLSVGELHVRKNHRVVLEALHRLKQPKILYLIAGQGKLEESYRRLIHKYQLENNVRLLGYRPDVDELCQAADCFIHPSVREGFGIAPVEAMAAGLALIASNINGIRDYAQDGLTGICISPRSVRDTARAIDKMYTDRDFRLKCGTYNAGKAALFDITKTDHRMKQIYRTIQEENNKKEQEMNDYGYSG